MSDRINPYNGAPEDEGLYTFNVNYTQQGSSIVGDGGKKKAIQDTAKVVTDTTKDTATSGFRDRENNFVYDNYSRISNAAAVASLVVGNYDGASIAHAYNALKISSNAETQSYLDTIGLGTANTQKLNAFNNEVWYQGMSSDGSTTLLQAKPGDDLYARLLSSSGGYVSHNIGGKDYTFSQDNYVVNVCNQGANMFVSSADIRAGYATENGQKVSLLGWKTATGGQDVLGSQMSSLLQSNISDLGYQAEREMGYHRDITHSFTKNAKMESMARINQASLDYLKGTNPEIKSEMEHILSNSPNKKQSQIFDSISKKLTLERVNASPMRQAEIDKMLDAIDKHMRLGGGKTDLGGSNGLSMQQRKGLQLIGNQFLGQDMMKGINFYAASYKATTHAVKAISHVGAKAGYVGIDLGAGLVEKTLGKINPSIGHKASQTRDWSKKKYAKHKERAAAKKRGGRTWKEYKRQERLEKRFEKQARINKKIKKNEELIKKGGKKSKIKYLKDKNAKLRKKLEKKAKKKIKDMTKKMMEKAIFEAIKAVIDTVSDVASVAAAICSCGADVIDDIKAVIAIIKWVLIILAALVVIAIITHFINCGLLVTFGAIIIEIFSLEPTHLSDYLNNRNFSQYIVDKTCTELGAEFLRTAQNDAQIHYLFDFSQAVNSQYSDGNGTYWKKDTTEGTIGKIWAREECDNSTVVVSGQKLYGDTYISNPSLRHELSGVNANMVPIMAMMNKRFGEELNFDNYCNAMAYVYTLYIDSHDKACFESGVDPYNYNEVDDCSKNSLYSQPLSPETVWDSENATRRDYRNTRNANGEFAIQEQCSNIYIHGYEFGLFQNIAEHRRNAQVFFGQTLQSLGVDVNIEQVGTVTLNDNGSWPSGNTLLDDCDNIVYAQFSTSESETTCGIPAHTHRPIGTYNSCYECVATGICTHQCDLPSNSSQDSECYDWKDIDGGGMMPPQWVRNCQHNCEESGCAHRCRADGADCVINRTCGYPEVSHEHVAWVSKSNPGCYKTVAICAGHCGGHIEPVVNISLISTFEGLMYDDCYKQTYWMTEGEMADPAAWMGEFDFKEWDLDNWKDWWWSKACSWYLPLPRSPRNLAESIGHELIANGAEMIDRASGEIAEFANQFIYMERSENSNPNDDPDKNPENYKDENGNPNDLYGFEGWYTDEDGLVLDQGLLTDLENMYGTMEEQYKVGYENMEMANVVIPIGPNQALSNDEIRDIFDKLKENGYTFTERQEAIVNEALQAAGMYWYQDTNDARYYATQHENGRSDELGMIASIINRALDMNITSPSSGTWTGSGAIKPGTIISNGENYAIYIGAFANDFLGIEGFSGPTYHWIVECSKDENGAIFRGVTAGELRSYHIRYNY